MGSSQLWIALSTLACFSGVGLTLWLHRQTRMGLPIPLATPGPETPLISVILPARDEARNLPRCLDALLAQTYPAFEIIVVDDGSTDATPQILADYVGRAARIRALAGQPLPSGWAGKPHALHQGVRAARGEWLCFMDADTFAAPELLASALAAAQLFKADLLSLVPEQELGTFWEKVVLPIVFTGMAVGWPAERVNDPTKPDAIAIGQFVLVRRAAYDAVGGHAAHGSLIVEDKALAQAVKSAGYRIVLGDGAGLVRTRMYHSLGEIWQGFTKNIYLGLRDRLPLLLFGVLVSLLGTFTLPIWAGLALGWLGRGGGWAAAAVLLEAAALWAIVLFVRARSAQAFGLSRWYALTLPLGTLVFAGLMLGSLFKIASGRGVTWKGRRYADG